MPKRIRSHFKSKTTITLNPTVKERLEDWAEDNISRKDNWNEVILKLLAKVSQKEVNKE